MSNTNTTISRWITRCKNALPKLFRVMLASYFVACIALYLMQGSMLFPSHAAPPMAEDWAPTIGTKREQALLKGRCGRLHVAKWDADNALGTVMIFHGNGENIASVESQVPEFLQLGYNVMAWDYPGYGRSSDCRFSQDDLLQDAETAYAWLIAKAPATSITLFGSSVGAGIALHVASQHPGQRVLLVAPYDTLANVAKDHMPEFLPISLLMRYPMPASEWIARAQGTIHAIHGTLDTLIRPERAINLMRYARGNAEIEWVEGAGHNDVWTFDQYGRWLTKQLSRSAQK